MKKLIIIGIVMLLILTSCNRVEKFEEVSSSYSMSLRSSIVEYSLTMSSVPGFPFDITCENNSEIELKLIVKCEGGTLLLWHEDGTIENIGMIYKGAFETTTLYWSPIEENGIETNTPINFSVSAYEVELEKETNRIDGEMLVNDEQHYIKRIK